MDKDRIISSGAIVGFGEVLWDVYDSHRTLGGAPFNVLGHLQQLGFDTQIVSRIGSDDLGKELITAIDQAGVGRDFLQIDLNLDTGIVKVSLDAEAKPVYDICAPAAWDHIEVGNPILEYTRHAEALVFGTLACRASISRKSLFRLLDEAPLCILDLNLREQYYTPHLIESLLHQVDILKINDHELLVLNDLFGLRQDRFYQELSRRFGLQLIVQTLGEKGAEAFDGNQVYRHPGYRVKVADTVGSGDAFLAGFLSTLLKGQAIAEALDLGCKLGAFVATQPGAIPHHGGIPDLD
ncbi:MAG: carbohydrate kinase [Saprospiraceae bacterium]|nr:carbohydrate kinase [Saprospiraceae bacterium]